METTKKLVMSFTTELDSRISINVDDPREDITEAEIKACMDLIVNKNIFAPKGEDIVTVVDAKIVVTDTTPYDLVL